MSVDNNNGAVDVLPGDMEDFEITKRLSFGEMSSKMNEKQRIDPNDVIQVLKDPTAERFVRYELVDCRTA